MRKFFKSITLFERLVWILGTLISAICFFVFRNRNYHYLIGAVIGFTAVLFVAKGNPLGQALIVVFSLFYGVISYSFGYYGEMITYLGMSLPMAAVALISWLRNPYKKGESEVKVNKLSRVEWVAFSAVAAGVTVAFYFILDAFKTTNLIISTLSVLTSFIAAYLTVRRSRFYAVGYAANDIVLIVMWSVASFKSITYLPMVVCFCVFAIFDVYGFVNWSKMSKRQTKASEITPEENGQ